MGQEKEFEEESGGGVSRRIQAEGSAEGFRRRGQQKESAEGVRRRSQIEAIPPIGMALAMSN